MTRSETLSRIALACLLALALIFTLAGPRPDRDPLSIAYDVGPNALRGISSFLAVCALVGGIALLSAGRWGLPFLLIGAGGLVVTGLLSLALVLMNGAATGRDIVSAVGVILNAALLGLALRMKSTAPETGQGEAIHPAPGRSQPGHAKPGRSQPGHAKPGHAKAALPVPRKRAFYPRLMFRSLVVVGIVLPNAVLVAVLSSAKPQSGPSAPSGGASPILAILAWLLMTLWLASPFLGLAFFARSHLDRKENGGRVGADILTRNCAVWGGVLATLVFSIRAYAKMWAKLDGGLFLITPPTLWTVAAVGVLLGWRFGKKVGALRTRRSS